MLLAALLPGAVLADAYEIGEAMDDEAFWRSDPVLFVKRNAAAGFEFTSDERAGADSRLDGGVTCYGLPVYESRISFAEDGGIDRVELMLYAAAGTETIRQVTDADGRIFRRRVRLEKSIDRQGFAAILRTVRAKLGKAPASVRAPQKDTSEHQSSQTWPRTAIPTETTLTWNYEQRGKNADTFRAGFVRLTVNGPKRLASARPSPRGAVRREAAKGARRIADNVVRDPRGDVFIDNVPMVDQGQKGYCSVATAERVLRYYGVEIDEHEIAKAAGTDAEGGTSTLRMKQSVESIGRRYRIGAVVCYGDFEKSAEERIAGIVDEVKAYNKAAKKLKKPAITEDVYIRHSGSTTYFNSAAADEAMDAEVRKEMKVNGMQKSRYKRFLKDIHDQVAKGIPLFWSVRLGIYPEPGLLQEGGYHMRLIIGYNDKKHELIYTDSWGAGHERKRMPIDWAWTISCCLMYLKPLNS